MTVKQVLKKLKSLGTERQREFNKKNGASEKQFGVKRGDVRKVAKELKTNHELALELWEAENIDARFLAILILKPDDLSKKEVEQMVKSETFTHLADWFTMYVSKKRKNKEALRAKWMKSKNKMLARAAWHLTSDVAKKDPDSLELDALLDRIEKEMPKAKPEVQWTMNFALVDIGISDKKRRKRAIAIGEEIGLYRDFPVPKGCTSPFAPIWIKEMVSRKKG